MQLSMSWVGRSVGGWMSELDIRRVKTLLHPPTHPLYSTSYLQKGLLEALVNQAGAIALVQEGTGHHLTVVVDGPSLYCGWGG